MKTGDVVRDSRGRSYQVGQLLGRGLWGKSYVVREESTSDEFVLKSALTREDFPADTSAPDEVLTACRDALLEQGRLLEDARWPFLPRLHARFTTADGTPVLLLPKYTTTLEKRLADGCDLSEVLETLTRVGGLLRLLADGPGYHGNLRPSNILLNDRGDIFLADLATRSSQAHVGRLHTLSLDSNGYLPPEIATNLGDASYSSVADTYAMGMILYRAIMTPPGTSHATRNLQVDLPAGGLDKATLLNLKDRVQEHLREQDSNARFHSRVAERAAAVLNRAISLETSPSPPFRFNRMEDFIPRVDEVGSLVRPGIQSVGKVLLDRPPASDTFETGEPVLFSVAVAASAGVEDHEEISCGIALFDEESGERLRSAECSYSADRHPSGRFRFAFVLPDLLPGGLLGAGCRRLCPRTTRTRTPGPALRTRRRCPRVPGGYASLRGSGGHFGGRGCRHAARRRSPHAQALGTRRGGSRACLPCGAGVCAPLTVDACPGSPSRRGHHPGLRRGDRDRRSSRFTGSPGGTVLDGIAAPGPPRRCTRPPARTGRRRRRPPPLQVGTMGGAHEG